MNIIDAVQAGLIIALLGIVIFQSRSIRDLAKASQSHSRAIDSNSKSIGTLASTLQILSGGPR